MADTNDRLGPHLAADRDSLKAVLEQGFATRPNRLTIDVLDGKKATPETVVGHYRGLRGKVQNVDTLLCYYTGHGATFQGKGHALTMGAGDLMRADLLKEMQGLNPRLVVVLTDCCSKIVPPPKFGGAVPAPPKATWPVMDFLFFNHKGVVDINGCQADAFSWCYSDAAGNARGGTFTLALVPLLCSKVSDLDEKNRFVTWQEFSDRLKKDTDAWFRRSQKEILQNFPNHDIGKQPSQDPEVTSLATKAEQVIAEKTWLLGVEHANAQKGPKPVVILTKVYPNTPAAEAGFLKDDLILAVDNRPVSRTEELDRALEHSDGTVEIEYEREKKRERLLVQLKPVKPK